MLFRSVEAFPSYMPDVESVKIVEGRVDSERVVTEWVEIGRVTKLRKVA